MVRIPVGNFGNLVPQAQESRTPVSTGGEYIAQGLTTLARSVQGVADQKAQDAKIAAAKAEAEAKKKQEEQDQADYLIQFSNFSLAESNASNQAKKDIEGGMSADTAAETYNAQVADAWGKTVDNIPASKRPIAQAAFTRSQNETLASLGPIAETAKARNSVAAFGQVFENGLNDANPDRGYATVAASLDLGVKSGAFTPEFAINKKQEFKNTKTVSNVKLQIGNATDVATLDKISGFLADEKQSANLTLPQRTAFQLQIAGQKQQLEKAAKVETDKREREATQAFNNLTSQIQSGGLLDADTFLNAAEQFKGTPLEGQEKTLAENYKHVQLFRQQPLSVQAAQLRQQQVAATSKETKNPIENQKWLGVYQDIYKKNLDMAKNSPLDYYANKTGNVLKPINFSVLLDPTGPDQLTAQIKERMSSLSALQQNDGNIVSANPFYPEEVATIKRVLGSAGDDAKLMIMSNIVKAAQTKDKDGNDTFNTAMFNGAMNALTGDNPALRLASLAQSKNLKSSYGANVANLVLAGDKVRKERTVTLPSDMLLQQEFNRAVAGAIPVGSEMHSNMMQMTQMIYAGLSARDGKTEQDRETVDKDIFRVAVGLATGGIGEHGGAKVIKPYAMTDDVFDSRVQAAIIQQANAAGLDYRNFDDSPLLPIMNGKEGAYLISDGHGGVIHNPKTKRPLVIEVGK